MHKKLSGDLISIAHRILKIKNKEDVLALKAEAYEVYEKLTVLAYVDEYFETTPNATETKEELITKISQSTKEEKVEPIVVVEEEQVVEEVSENEEIEQPFAELEEVLFGEENPYEIEEEVVIKKDNEEAEDKKVISLEDELDDTISLDIAADMFEKVPVQKSLNDNFQGDLQIGLNDRIAFVNHLFNGNQEDFNRVVSQLNTIKTENEAVEFIQKMIKPDYNWENKEEYEERFMSLITRKFA